MKMLCRLLGEGKRKYWREVKIDVPFKSLLFPICQYIYIILNMAKSSNLSHEQTSQILLQTPQESQFAKNLKSKYINFFKKLKMDL